jgi:hypothetical protein
MLKPAINKYSKNYQLLSLRFSKWNFFLKHPVSKQNQSVETAMFTASSVFTGRNPPAVDEEFLENKTNQNIYSGLTVLN